VRLSIAVERREAYLLLALVVLMFAIWLIQIDRLPASIWGDEGAYWTFARDIALGLVQPNAFGMGTYSYPAAGSFYQAIWASLFGPSIASWRIGSVVAALASMLPLYFLTRSLLGKRIAFVSLAFFAASPFVLAYGRTGYLYPQSIFPVAAGAALSVAALRRDSRLLAFLAGVASGGSFMLYPSARFALVLCPLIGLAFMRLARASTLARLGLVYASAAILAAAPAAAYGLLREPEAFVDKLVENSMANVPFAESVVGRDELLARASFASTRDHQLFYEPSLYASLALRGEVMTAIGLSRGGLANEHYVVGPLAAPGTLLYVLGLAWCLARARRPAYRIWPIWLFAGTFLLSAIETQPPHASDLLPIAPVLAVLAAAGLVGLFETARAYLRGMSRRVQLGLLAAATGLVCLTGLLAYFVEMPRRYRPNFEMSMFWSALELSRGSTVIFVRDQAYPPEFEPWGMQNFDTGVAWLPIEPAELDQADLPAACAIDCRVFYTPSYAAATEPRLRQVLGAGGVQSYENELGETIGYAYSPSDRP
jgi:4-amino-4-deoxy-L-arabinose transferase-like glycosyltransferase